MRFFDDTVKALADYATIKAKPDEPKLYDNRAQIYFKQGKYDLSDEDYSMLFLLLVLNVVGKTILSNRNMLFLINKLGIWIQKD